MILGISIPSRPRQRFDAGSRRITDARDRVAGIKVSADRARRGPDFRC